MKKYLSFFRLRFSMGLQYRAAAAAGITTQFAWGGLELLVFRAFYEADASAFPMSLQQTSVYVWLQQAFLSLFMVWMMEHEIFDGIRDGNIVYELCRPIQIYQMWFARSIANRLSRTVLRCLPILLLAFLLPAPYGLPLPFSLQSAFFFLLALVLGLVVTVAFCMLIYVLTFFTVTPDGLRIFCVSAVELLAGEIIPIPFFPEPIAKVLEWLPFASMQNVPLRIYSGNLDGGEALHALALQVFWAVVLIALGKVLMTAACRKMVIQGG